jgi:nitroreductase
MTFEDYFRLEGQSLEEQLLRFFLGLAPKSLQQIYLLDASTINFHTHRGPSMSLACDLCAGVAAGQVLKILLQRGKVVAVPKGLQFDAYRNQLAHTWLPGGMANPFQQIKLWLARRRFTKVQMQIPSQFDPSPQAGLIHQILDLARWAPSGDNTQPWRFVIKADNHVVIQGFDTRDRVVYDLEGRASQTALGALIETIDLAAQAKGLQCKVRRRMDTVDEKPAFDIYFHPVTVQQSADDMQLARVIRVRCTQRRALSRRRLNHQQRNRLMAAVGKEYDVVWLEGQPALRKVAQLLFLNAHVRLTMPEAYTVHRDIIQWHAQYSPDRIPEQALGLDPLTTRLMQWTLASWRRVAFMNRYLGGTLLPRLQLDVWPALNCAAHFVVLSPHPLRSIDDYVAGGRIMQRLWLTATALGLQYQPEMTPLIFASYVQHGIEFTKQPRCIDNARIVSKRLANLIGQESSERAGCMGRVGFGPAPVARSTRLPLKDLLISA